MPDDSSLYHTLEKMPAFAFFIQSFVQKEWRLKFPLSFFACFEKCPVTPLSLTLLKKCLPLLSSFSLSYKRMAAKFPLSFFASCGCVFDVFDFFFLSISEKKTCFFICGSEIRCEIPKKVRESFFTMLVGSRFSKKIIDDYHPLH